MSSTTRSGTCSCASASIPAEVISERKADESDRDRINMKRQRTPDLDGARKAKVDAAAGKRTSRSTILRSRCRSSSSSLPVGAGAERIHHARPLRLSALARVRAPRCVRVFDRWAR